MDEPSRLSDLGSAAGDEPGLVAVPQSMKGQSEPDRHAAPSRSVEGRHLTAALLDGPTAATYLS